MPANDSGCQGPQTTGLNPGAHTSADLGNHVSFSETTPGSFRWQALFQRASDPVFVLDRHRRFLFVNQAWEKLTGMTASEARGLTCIRRAALPQDPPDLVIRSLCCPSPEAVRGQPARVNRQLSGSGALGCRWTIDFLPIRRGKSNLLVIGRISPSACQEAPPTPPLPERLGTLRQTARQRYTIDTLGSGVAKLRRATEQVRLASQTRVPVMLSGEAGTGKTWVARVIHGLTAEAEDGFAVIDCGRLPSAVVVELLFAAKSPLTLLQKGTIYLRDPNRLPRDVQVQLAGWLEEHAADGPRILIGCRIEESGEHRSAPLDDQLIGIVDTLQINLPPLRDRLPDLPKLIEHMLHRINSLRDAAITGLSDQAWEYFRAYRWPGNLRELYAALQTSSARTDKEYIDVNHLPAPVRLAVRMQAEQAPPAERTLALDAILQEAERRLIVAALRKARGNRTKAAELLSIWRARLVRRMGALGIQG